MCYIAPSRLFLSLVCFIRLLTPAQVAFGLVVAAREVLYLATTLAGVLACPSYLLLDLPTTWAEAGSRRQGSFRGARRPGARCKPSSHRLQCAQGADLRGTAPSAAARRPMHAERRLARFSRAPEYPNMRCTRVTFDEHDPALNEKS